MIVERPGFVDLQVNGFAGVDFNAPDTPRDELARALAAIRATGVTRCLPTLITSPFDAFAGAAKAITGLDDPTVAGIHMEGPYISPEDGARGAHAREHTSAASREDFDRRQEAASGRIRLVTLAPEVPGALGLIEYLVDRDVRVAIGHTNASAAVLADAARAGATLSTHLGNGCAAMLPRHPNVIWDQLADDRLLMSVIVDGHHLAPSAVKSMIRAKSPARTILVTDAMAAAGSDPGTYRLGRIEVDVGADRRVSLRGTSLLAGSALSMGEAVANAVRFAGVTVEEALAMASTVPAAYLGIATAGRIKVEVPGEGDSHIRR